MSSLTVDAVKMNFATVRTEHYTCEPVMDPSGRHFECHRITLSIVAVVNSVAVAGNKAIPGAAGIDSPAGDSLPTSMRDLARYLSQPRRRVTYEVGGVVVLQAPKKNPNTGLPFLSDVRGGPIPGPARFTQITGDKTAVLQYSVVAHVSDSRNFVLSHAWDVSSTIDRNGYTTKTTRGRIAYRKDFLDGTRAGGSDLQPGTLQPDDFRPAALPPISLGMRRVHVHVDQPRTADELEYVVQDREVTHGLGSFSDITEVQGSVTSSVEYSLKDFKSAVGELVGIAKDAWAGPGGWANIVGRVWDKGVPICRNSGTARALGRKGANRHRMGTVARDFILDRLRPLKVQAAFRGPFRYGMIVAAMHVTHNIDTDGNPWAEAKIEVMGNDLLADPFVEGAVFNLSNDYFSQTAEAMASPVFASPELPSSNNSRGTWLRRLISQALAAPDAQQQAPGAVKPDEKSVNVNDI